MDKFAEALLCEHRNPIVKLSVKCQKGNASTENNAILNEILEELRKVVNTNRVDRRCARSKLKWLNSQQKAEAIKIVGSVTNSYGFQDKTGKFFYPEEAMFLLETNKAEIFWNSVPLSIQKAFEVIITEHTCNFNKYKAYKQLCLQGYKVTRPLKSTGDYQTPCKKFKKDNDNKNTEVKPNSLQELLRRLQENSPKLNNQTSDLECEFFVYKKKRKGPDYKLGFLNSTFNDNIGLSKDINLYCFSEKSDVSFLTCESVELPTLC